MHVLLIDDDTAFTASVAERLSDRHRVSCIGTAREAENQIVSTVFDVIILDIRLPDGNGVQLCQAFRSLGVTTPILILTGSNIQPSEAAEALNAGADDYLTKPFLFDELLARLQALVRRGSGDYRSNVIAVNGLALDTRNRTVRIDDRVITLRNKEYRILKYLMLNAGRTVTRTQILEHVWDDEEEPNTNSIDAHILQLRRKLGASGKHLIRTIHGFGYKIASHSEG